MALDTIDDHFKWLQGSISYHGMINHSAEFRNFAEYMDMLQKTFTLVQQIEEKDKRIKKND